MNKSIMRN